MCALPIYFPMLWDDPQVEKILEKDANEKYIVQSDGTDLDEHVKIILTPPWLKK